VTELAYAWFCSPGSCRRPTQEVLALTRGNKYPAWALLLSACDGALRYVSGLGLRSHELAEPLSHARVGFGQEDVATGQCGLGKAPPIGPATSCREDPLVASGQAPHGSQKPCGAAPVVQSGTDAVGLVAMLPPAAAAGFTFGLAVVRPRANASPQGCGAASSQLSG